MYRELHAALWLDPRHPPVPVATHTTPKNGYALWTNNNKKDGESVPAKAEVVLWCM